jgi:predicted DNA binding protein
VTRSDDGRELLSVSLEVWHPDCWGIESTDEVGNGLVGHGAAVDGDAGYERVTLYGDSPDHLAQAVEVAHESAFIRSIDTLGGPADVDSLPGAIGRTARDAFIEYDATAGIGSALLSQGFVLESSYRVEAGRETWDLLVYATRSSLDRSLDAIRRDRDAAITLASVSPVSSATARGRPSWTPTPPATGASEAGTAQASGRLTARQREALALARERGYYEWPRSVSAADLAADLGVSKATFLEHLRTAEAALLDPEGT